MIESDYIQPPEPLPELLERTGRLGFNMASEPLTGALLKTLAAAKPGGQFLEVGTGTGIATAWLLAGMDANSRLTSVDINAEAQQIARDVLGSDPRLNLVFEDGLEFIRRQATASFDLVFADAMPGKYEGLGDCLRLVRPGGFWIGDDLLPQPNWPQGHEAKVPLLFEALAHHPGFVIVPMAWASGLVLAVRRAAA